MSEQTSGPTEQEVHGLRWWHSLRFPNGVVSPGVKASEFIEAEADIVFKYPVENKTVLDIGAWNGYFSFEAARRGAAAVTAMDHYVWSIPEYQAREGFELGRTYIDSSVAALELDVMDLTPAVAGTFDVVLFLGVLYHLKHPLYALELISKVCRERIVIETFIDLTDSDQPRMAFYPGSELLGDPTNWVGPNVACVQAMLSTAGFTRSEVVPHPNAPEGYPRAFFHAWK